jgi:LAGLIDADG endonuclease
MFFNHLDTISLAPTGASGIESSSIELSPGALENIGIISPYALKRGRKYISNKKDFLNIPYAFLSVLIGIIDGDGHISITKTNKGYIKMNLVISLNIRDLSLLEYVYSILRLGKIKTYPKSKVKDTCKLVIHKTDLQYILFPLLRYHKLYF